MIFNMGGRCHLTAQLSNIKRSSDFFQLATLTELLLHSKNIYRFLINGKIGNSCINQLMPMFVKRFRTENLTHQRIGIFFNHQGPEHGFFQFRRLRLDAPVIIYGLHLRLSSTAGISSLFGHLYFIEI